MMGMIMALILLKCNYESRVFTLFITGYFKKGARMRIRLKIRGAENGFTLIEMLIVMAIMAVLAGIAIPMFSVMTPDYKLKQAAQDLYSNLQNAKMEAVRTNNVHYIEFEPGSNTYTHKYIDKNNGNAVVPLDSYSLASYGKGIIFGKGDANEITGIGSYTDDKAQFNTRGMGLTEGCVYLTNSKKSAYAVCSRLSGVVTIRKWVSGSWR
jgi:prepilin-type N-terminal cleavage/methylation domain-containing protein